MPPLSPLPVAATRCRRRRRREIICFALIFFFIRFDLFVSNVECRNVNQFFLKIFSYRVSRIE